ncbi:hypothetical protein SBRCBS47491_010003 [Sporothrix bragantina]|uniref:RRM domain-containing protein n=1 Tax=Sporothrix bragantina TaxID=671064 RepID=A0ABP0D2M6_9PEZI
MATYQPTVDTGFHNRRGGVSSGYNVAPTDLGPHAHHGAAPGAGIQMPDDGLAAMMNQFSAMSLPPGNLGQNGHMPNIPTGAFVNGPDGSIVFATPYPGALHPLLADHGYGAPYPMQYPAGGYAPAYGHGTMMPFTPGRPIAYGDRIPRELPVLENRRSSYSTSATESAPATPFFGHAIDRLNGGARVASHERSSYTTPSPRDGANYVSGAAHIKVAADPDIDRLLMQEPQVPKAVPAVWTDHVKPLEQCLENRIQGNRNVYIRGLHPTTDDDLLLKYTERFGEVEQSKAIIDTATGACKGFGFAKFKDVKDSEKCIRGFYRRGYEVGFARESFNARLKAEGDDGSTNLYISNLPKDVNESMLGQIFDPFHIVSSKILRDSMGNSRGVGFARFETRDICEKVIKNFHGMTIGQENYVMQVRYADTPSQKELKRITSERRQYRTNEYNIGAYGTHAVGINPSIYAPALWNRRSQGNSSGFSGHSLVRHASHPAISSSYSNNDQTIPTSRKATTDGDAASTADGSGDEGATIVERSVTAEGSPTPKPVSVKKDAA